MQGMPGGRLAFMNMNDGHAKSDVDASTQCLSGDAKKMAGKCCADTLA